MSKGIDIPIDSLVTEFNSALWVGKDNQFYGRVFRNERFEAFGTTISPEIWLSANKPAIELLKNDNFDAQCFFDVQPTDTINGGDIHNSVIWICFMVDLVALYPLLTRQEATEQVQRDVLDIITTSEFIVTGLVRGFEGFTSYDWGRDTQPHADIHPHYCFRFETTLEYVNSNC